MTPAPGGQSIDLPAGEHDILRVFAIDLPAAAIRDMLPPNGTQNRGPVVTRLLGATPVDDRHAELIDMADLAGLGLSGYLRDAYDLPLDTLGSGADHLDGLQGYVLVLLSQAFDRQATRLTPDPALRLLATVALPGADNTIGRFTPPGKLAHIGGTAPAPNSPHSRSFWPPLLLLIAAIAAILLWLALS